MIGAKQDNPKNVWLTLNRPSLATHQQVEV